MQSGLRHSSYTYSLRAAVASEPLSRICSSVTRLAAAMSISFPVSMLVVQLMYCTVPFDSNSMQTRLAGPDLVAFREVLAELAETYRLSRSKTKVLGCGRLQPYLQHTRFVTEPGLSCTGQ